MKAMSDKKRAQLAAQGITNPYSTLLPSSAKKAPELEPLPPELRRRATKKAYRSTGPDKLTVDTVWERDEGRCGWCGHPIDPDGVRSVDWSVGHRRPRQMGGDPRPDTNSPANLELLHGSGVTSCHGEIENKRRAAALGAGHLLPGNAVPSQHAIEHAVHGWVYLTDDGDWVQEPPVVSA